MVWLFLYFIPLILLLLDAKYSSMDENHRQTSVLLGLIPMINIIACAIVLTMALFYSFEYTSKIIFEKIK